MAPTSLRPRAPGSLRHRMIVPVLVAAGVLAVAALLLAMVADLVGDDGGNVALATTTAGTGVALLLLLVVGIAHVRLIRVHDIASGRTHAMMAAMRDGICCADTNGRLAYLNAAGERLLGIRLEDRLGEALDAVLPLRHRESRTGQNVRLLERVLDSGSYEGRDSVVCDDGAILFVDVRAAPITVGGEPAGTVVVFSDDTERTREEQAKDDFVGFASHELRNPLTALLGFSSWLARKLEAEPWRFDADTAEAIAALTSETGRMESIIELFLDLTQIRMDRLDLEHDLVDLTTLVQEEAAAIRSRYPAAEVEEVLPAARVLAVLDQQRLRQVILNLLDNAAKYGGDAPRIIVSLTVGDAVAELRVADSGSGIPADDQAHIFERFFRSGAPATGRKKGFGIGLYVTKQIVDRMGGELTFVSEEGRGTEFTLRMPLARLAVG